MIDREELFRKLNEGILQERYLSFKRNLRKNLPAIQRHGGLQRLVPHFEGKAVIVAGAGPSLESGLESLKRFQHRRELIIIAIDMALRPLIYHGIMPRFVISCETTPVEYFRGLATEEMHLLAFSCISPVNLRMWQGDISFYNWMIHRSPYEELWETAGTDLGFVATGNLVSTQAVSFALGCRIHSLLLVGNDLGFSERYYARGTVSSRKRLYRIDRTVTLETTERRAVQRAREYSITRNGRVYYTNSQFLAGKLWLEELFQKQRVPIYDSSEPGCSEEHVIKKGVSEYLDRFERKRSRRRK